MIAFVPTIQTVGDLDRALANENERLVTFAQRFRSTHAGEPRSTSLPRGIAVFFLSLLLVAETADISTVRRYLDDVAIGESATSRRDLASEILKTLVDLRDA